MDADLLSYFRGILFAEKVRVMGTIQHNGNPILIEELRETERLDKPQVVTRHDAELNALESQLRDLEVALHKCEKGTYGLCADCHEPILLARLKAIPTASRCVMCQKKHHGVTTTVTAIENKTACYFVKRPW